MVAQGFTVDHNKPLVFQVGHLGESYEEWVHQPIVTKEGPRFFHSDFWEVHKFLSPFLFSNRQCQQASDLHYLDTLAMETVLDPYKMVGDSCNLVASCDLVHLQVSKYGPFAYRNRPIDSAGNIYLDVYRIYSSPVPFPHQDQELLGKHGALSSSRMSSQAPNGPPSTRLSSCCNSGFMLSCKHFFDHHHLHYPHHKIKALTRLFILCDQFWNLVKLFATPSTTPALFGGGMLGYVMYDVTHYYLHHAQPTRAVTKNLKKYHLNHHFRIQDKGFGITSSLWDIVFGTLPTTKAPKREQ
ncbi:unnamed protein product [Brassica oleracea]|uniref:Fatty acid hydroxylase domain-containing protein n=1 Tax=Brassica oleracea var. oleracea TaxID=109376 RepID=A0A0D3B4X3_BRAOL